MLIPYQDKIELYQKAAKSFYKKSFQLNVNLSRLDPFRNILFLNFHHQNKIPQTLFMPPVWFKCQLKIEQRKAIFTEEQGYMETAFRYKRKNLQQLLQAIAYDIFDIQTVDFEQTLSPGLKFIEKSPLFIPTKDTGFKIFCKIDQEHKEKIIKKFLSL